MPHSRILADVEAVLCVAAKSANLKGTYVRALKEAARSINDATEKLAHRTQSAEINRLEAENEKLRKQVEYLTGEMKEIRNLVKDLRCEGRISTQSFIPPPGLSRWTRKK